MTTDDIPDPLLALAHESTAMKTLVEAIVAWENEPTQHPAQQPYRSCYLCAMGEPHGACTNLEDT